MRQGQQHRRGRSRGSSGGNGSHSHQHRKGQNPLARSFESNGPDVKVRGTAADIAAKYIALARDAQSSSDPVLAENYLQHAEHYNRMIITYREQQIQQGGEAASGNGHRPRHMHGAEMGDAGEEGEGEGIADPGMGEQPPVPSFARHPGQEPQPQPRHENGRHDERRDDRRQHGRHQESRQDNRHERGDNPRFRDRRYERPDYRGERTERAERHEGAADEPRQSREPAPAEQPQPPVEAGESAPRESTPTRRRERFDMMKDQPEFLRRPVRRPRREEAVEGDDQDGGSTQEKPGA
jgi:hypothetical protein